MDEDFGFDESPEPYENDLEEFGNREAWEDGVADRESARREQEGLLECDTCSEDFVRDPALPDFAQQDCPECQDAYDRTSPHPLDIAAQQDAEDRHLEGSYEDRYDRGE